MKKTLIIFLTILFQFSCGSESCIVDPSFEETFKQMRGLVKSDQENQGGLSNDAVRGVFYLQKLTERKSKAIIGDLSYYNSLGDYKSDMNNWNQWYKKNKCLITAEVSDSVLSLVNESTKWMDEN